jgi:mRNA interferase YafQ
MIQYTRQFKRDYKREQKPRHFKGLDAELFAIINLLVSDILLPPNKHDHALKGDWDDHRDCHIRPDLILIYRKPNKNTLELVRLGSHSELSL